jgi:DNA-binding transcriptional ArsR family regulator
MATLEKTEVVRARVTEKEVLMLRALAGRDGTASEVIRSLIRAEYESRFGKAKPRMTTQPTLRGIIDDLTGTIHFTIGNIAERAELPRAVVVQALEKLEARGLVEAVDGRDEDDATWESIVVGGRDALVKRAEAAGLSLDVPLVAKKGAK